MESNFSFNGIKEVFLKYIFDNFQGWLSSLIVALVILFVGLFLAKRLKSVLEQVLRRAKVDVTLQAFLTKVVHMVLVVFVVISAVGKLGIETTSFAAVIASAGLAIGLALQGSLSNFASGILIILFRPFKVGDFITAGGETGVVNAVSLLTTELRTGDNVKIILPNSSIMSGSITNVSAYDTRRIDMVIGVGYQDNLNEVKELMLSLLAQDKRVLQDPAPQIGVSNLGESSVDFIVRPWVKAEDYWNVKFDFLQRVKELFDTKGISIPYPQQELHIRYNNEE